MPRQYDPLALEEIKLLEEVVRTQEGARTQIVGWSVAIVSALTAVYFSDKPGLQTRGFFLLASAVVVLFFWLDVIHKVAQDRAARRSRIIEEQIRNAAAYDGPLLGETLLKDNSFRAQCGAANNIRVWGPPAALFAVIVIASASHR